MPVYLCKPGCWAAEPWRHGIQVYEQPFPLEQERPRPPAHRPDTDETSVIADNLATREQNAALAAANIGSQRRPSPLPPPKIGRPARRVRHAEVVLVDDVSIAYGRYWLRLRWPGPSGGFAGYIALGTTLPWNDILRHPPTPFGRVAESPADTQKITRSDDSEREEAETDDKEMKETRDESLSAPSPGTEANEVLVAPRCKRTGLCYPSSSAMELLAAYDDGISLDSYSHEGLSPVFCRICREGLHDVSDDEQPPNEQSGSSAIDTMSRSGVGISAPGLASNEEDLDLDSDSVHNFAPELPYPTYRDVNVLAENPLLAPCECSGSMAFVHYLCVEQWRCRSRHPDARNGLHCETCGGAYALPPPSSRPVTTPVEDEDWLEAMPAHVLAALRRPHPWWQIGAAMVRRKWLRPLAPVILSPIVALYCRARRLLKKRGVSRRRWACSLCRRRARWKCVRCLRSYYCSRQCQNVSWHIVHKHICYKPSRFWCSVVVYGAGTILCFPGILRDPLIYDLGLTLIPGSFMVMAVLGGSFASAVKKGFGVDLRGRALESMVVALSLLLVTISWGLMWAFFGDSSQCWGAFGPMEAGWRDGFWYRWLQLLKIFLFQPAKSWFLFWDGLALKSGPWIAGTICTNTSADEDGNTGCFPYLKRADALFFEDDVCASDLSFVSSIWMVAITSLTVSTIFKKRGGNRHGVAADGVRDNGPRPHHD